MVGDGPSAHMGTAARVGRYLGCAIIVGRKDLAVAHAPVMADRDVYSFEDFVEGVQEKQKAHLLQGLMVMESPATLRHESIQMFVGMLLTAFVTNKNLGMVFGPNAAFKLGDYDGIEPDASFLARAHLNRMVSPVYVEGPPDIAVEIVSRGTRTLDYQKKCAAYEAAGTPELWIIDYLRDRCDFFRQAKSGFQNVALEDGHIFRSTVLPGFWLDTAWVLGEALPPSGRILRQLLRPASRKPRRKKR